MPWVEKYRPRSLNDLIVSDEILSQLSKWVDSWKDGVPTKPALILHGKPGMGKTSCAYAIAEHSGWKVVEMNASEQRNRDSVRRVALMASLYSDITGFETGTEKRKLILVDEADNMFESRSSSTGGDAGGTGELARVVRETMNPIIITMNDFYEFRRRGQNREIADNSTVIDFSPYKRKNTNEYKQFRLKLMKRIRFILDSERVSLPQKLINDILDRDNMDLRSVINDLESFSGGVDSTTSDFEISVRDRTETPFNIMMSTFRAMSYDDVLDALLDKEGDFTTEDYMMWIDKNLPEEAKEFEDLSMAFDLLSLADVFIGRVLKKQHYAFKRYSEELAAGMMTRIEKRNRSFVKYQFPSYITTMARTRGSRLSRNSLATKLGRLTHSSSSTAMDYMWFFSYISKKQKKNFSKTADRIVISDKEEEILKKG
ncbi:MAG: replication factor C large subunit [Thermoplasmataceae archaeon]